MRRAGRTLPEEAARLLSPFFPGFDLHRVRIFEGIPRYVVGGPIGYADRYNIYFAPGTYRFDTPGGLALAAHEIAHCQQYCRHGAWRFRARYLAAYLKNRLRGMNHASAYRNIPFEIEARAIEDEVYRAVRKRPATSAD